MSCSTTPVLPSRALPRSRTPTFPHPRTAAARHLHICSIRSRFFLLPPARSRPPRGQATLSAAYQQLADSLSLAPDSSAGEPYAVCVRACISLLLLGSEGQPAAALSMAAGNALLASCGLGVGEMRAALQQQLLAPGSVAAGLVVEALQQALAELQRHRVHQVRLGRALFNLSVTLLAGSTGVQNKM